MQEAKASIWRKVGCFYGLLLTCSPMDESAVAGSPMDESAVAGSPMDESAVAGSPTDESAVAGHSSHSLDPLAGPGDVNPLMMPVSRRATSSSCSDGL